MDDRALLELLDRDHNAGMEALLGRYAPLLRYVVGGVLRDRSSDCFRNAPALHGCSGRDVPDRRGCPAGVRGAFPPGHGTGNAGPPFRKSPRCFYV